MRIPGRGKIIRSVGRKPVSLMDFKDTTKITDHRIDKLSGGAVSSWKTVMYCIIGILSYIAIVYLYRYI